MMYGNYDLNKSLVPILLVHQIHADDDGLHAMAYCSRSKSVHVVDLGQQVHAFDKKWLGEGGKYKVSKHRTRAEHMHSKDYRHIERQKRVYVM